LETVGASRIAARLECGDKLMLWKLLPDGANRFTNGSGMMGKIFDNHCILIIKNKLLPSFDGFEILQVNV
jgi:hypothetical protein